MIRCPKCRSSGVRGMAWNRYENMPGLRDFDARFLALSQATTTPPLWGSPEQRRRMDFAADGLSRLTREFRGGAQGLDAEFGALARGLRE